MRRSVSVLLLSIATISAAKTEPSITMLWPDSNQPTIKLTFGKFRQIGGFAGENTFVSEVTVQNTSSKSIPRASFTVYLLDKSSVRIGDGVLRVSDLGPGQETKVAFQFSAVGLPASIRLAAQNDPSGIPSSIRTISLKVISVPSGAKLKVDGQDSGQTPVIVNLMVGTHNLQLAKEGYANANTPVEITPDELPGGSVTIELGGLSHDALELRDGTVLLGDVMSLSMTGVVMRIDGKDETHARNLVKKITLVEREITQQPGVTQPSPH